MKQRLSILISTINDRIQSVPEVLLPMRPDVEYVVSFQYTASVFLEMIPAALTERSDVKLLPSLTIGLSRNRNNALRHCDTELAIIADDDVRYTTKQIDNVFRAFAQHTDVDIICFQVVDSQNHLFKPYPNFTFNYSQRPKGFYFNSIEIALRTDALLPLFDTRFGLGSPYLSCGEEEVFLHQAHCCGARITYVPQVLCSTTNTSTTGTRFATDIKVRRSKGAVLYMMHGFLGGLLRLTKHALFHTSQQRWISWKNMLEGMLYILRNPLNEGITNEASLEFHTFESSPQRNMS